MWKLYLNVIILECNRKNIVIGYVEQNVPTLVVSAEGFEPMSLQREK